MIRLRAFGLFWVGAFVCALPACNERASSTANLAPPTTAPMTPAQDHAPPKSLPEVSVAILGPISSLKGHEWPLGYDIARDRYNLPVSMTAASEPHILLVHLPGGRSVDHMSKLTFFTQKRGVVDRASFVPHPGFLQYQDVIRLLELILQQWDAQFDEPTSKVIAEWKKEGDLQPWELAQRHGSAKLRGDERVGIYFEIRPVESGWFLVLDVAATLEEQRKLWGRSSSSTSQAAGNQRPAIEDTD